MTYIPPVITQDPMMGRSEFSSGSGSSFTGIEDPESKSALSSLISQLLGGGSEAERAQRSERRAEIGNTRGIREGFSKESAFRDAASLMDQNLRQSLEKNMPVINKAIQGSGTSAGSMQALLSQKLATESAQAAGALGAEQARAYGSISAQLSGVLEALTRADPSNTENLLKALDLTKITRQQQQNTGSASGGGGGGTRVQTPGSGGSMGDLSQSRASPTASLTSDNPYGRSSEGIDASEYRGGWLSGASYGGGSGASGSGEWYEPQTYGGSVGVGRDEPYFTPSAGDSSYDYGSTGAGDYYTGGNGYYSSSPDSQYNTTSFTDAGPVYSNPVGGGGWGDSVASADSYAEDSYYEDY